MASNTIINKIRKELKLNIDEKAKITNQNFFKEKIKLYGVRTPVVGKIGKIYFKAIQEKKKAEIFNLCEELWQSGYIEESLIACNWSYFLHKDFAPNDFKIFEHWIENYVNNWASCDTLCNHTIGEFLEMYPEYLSELKRWAKSKNRWMRRASSVSLIIPAKKGKYLKDIFEIADILLLDTDDMVQKGYGWMLKAASHKNQEQVFNFVISKKNVMPRTSLRYAIEKMPVGLKKKAMER
jgi:3-methyladenine DNA glycosylase AlkD